MMLVFPSVGVLTKDIPVSKTKTTMFRINTAIDINNSGNTSNAPSLCPTNPDIM